MKNERVLKVTEKYNEKWMFLMKFRKEWNTHCQRIKMNEITNIALFDIFKACKKNRFAKEPDFNKVLNQVS